jgi:hypothetical protein
MTVPNNNTGKPAVKPAKRPIAQTHLFKHEWTDDMTTNRGPHAAHALKRPLYPLNRITPHDRPVKYLEVQP